MYTNIRCFAATGEKTSKGYSFQDKLQNAMTACTQNTMFHSDRKLKLRRIFVVTIMCIYSYLLQYSVGFLIVPYYNSTLESRVES